MPYPLPLTRTEAYLAYKAGVIQQSDLKPSLAVPRNGIDAWLAYWTGLAADYPKREDGTPHILQEEEAYIAYLCGVINEYPEKCLRRVGAYLRYLISARWGRPDHPLNREELYLSLIKTQYIPSGDPSSDIEIDGTAKAPFVDVKMYGDTAQQTYSGKNLLAYPYFNTTKTEGGITFTDNGDGSVTVNGTLTGINEELFWITREIWSYNTQNIVVPAGTYTISPTGNPNVRVYVSAYGETQGLLASVDSSTASATFTVSEKASLTVRISVKPKGTAVNNLVIKPQLESGSTSTDYESFVGGQPSPSPDYPQPIQTVTGLQTVEIQGKNLIYLEPNTGSPNLNGLSASYDNKSGAIHIYGTPTDSWSNIGARTNLSLPAGTYTISATDNQQTHSKSVYAYHPDGTRTQFYIGPDEQFKTVTVSKPIVNYYIYVSQMTIGEAIDDTFYMQLEKGSTATDYEPYSSNDYEINLGKNILSMADETITGGSAVSAVSSNNHFEISGTVSESWGFNLVATRKQIAPIQPGTYTLSITNPLPYNTAVQFRNTSSGASLVGNLNFPSGTTSITFTLNKTANYITWWSTASVGTTITVSFDAMIEAGSQATTYAPYFTPIELCKLGSYQDYIYKDGDSWKVHKETGKYVFTGEEDMSFDSSIPRVYIGYPVLNSLGIYPVYPLNVDTLPMAVNSKFTGKTFTEFYTNSESNGFAMSTSGRNFNFGNKSWETSTQARSDISGNICYYAKASSYITDTIITNQALIDQLEALVAGGAENGTTYIKVDATDPNLPGLLYVEAPKYE